MDQALWRELKDLLEKAMALPPEQRGAFVEEVRKRDTALGSRLAALMSASGEAPAYFGDPLTSLVQRDAAAAEDVNDVDYADEDSRDLVGRTIARYRINGVIGEGGMGVVYRAEDTRLRRTVALKFLPPTLTRKEEARQRFIHEAQAASVLDHPNICTIFAIEQTARGQLFIAMAYYEGETLKEKIAGGPVPVEDVCKYAAQVAGGLFAAHRREIIHRDIKPANLMIVPDTVGEIGGRQVKILDFGLAKVADATKVTKTGSTMGTVAYMSPEQARGEVVDHRTDIWSLGVVLYEMLTGMGPFQAHYENAILYAIAHEEPARVTDLNPVVPPALASIVHRCLQKDRGARYGSAAELRADLESVLTKERSERKQSPSGLTAPIAFMRTQKPLLVVASGMVILCAVLVFLLLVNGGLDHGMIAGFDGKTMYSAQEVGALFEEGRTAYFAGDFERALGLFDRILSEDTVERHDRIEALNIIARIHVTARNSAEARKTLEQLLALEPPLIELDPDVEPPPLMQLYYELRSDQDELHSIVTPGVETLAIVFENHSAYEEYDPLMKGLASMMIHNLSGDKELKILARETFEFLQDRYPGSSMASPWVDILADCSFMKVGEDVRIGATVTKVETGEVLFTDSIQGSESELLAMIEIVSLRLARSLNSTLSKSEIERRAETNSLDAMLSYSEGLKKLEEQDFRGAHAKFMEAVSFDPDYERARRKAESLLPVLAATPSER